MITVKNCIVVTCEPKEGTCASRMFSDVPMDEAATRRTVAERGWGVVEGRDVCPKHRDGS